MTDIVDEEIMLLHLLKLWFLLWVCVHDAIKCNQIGEPANLLPSNNVETSCSLFKRPFLGGTTPKKDARKKKKV